MKDKLRKFALLSLVTSTLLLGSGCYDEQIREHMNELERTEIASREAEYVYDKGEYVIITKINTKESIESLIGRSYYDITGLIEYENMVITSASYGEILGTVDIVIINTKPISKKVSK